MKRSFGSLKNPDMYGINKKYVPDDEESAPKIFSYDATTLPVMISSTSTLLKRAASSVLDFLWRNGDQAIEE